MKGINWGDLGEIIMELGGAKLTLDIVDAILPQPVSIVNKATALVIGSAIGNMAFHNQVDPFYEDVEKILEAIKAKRAKELKDAEANS